MVIAKFVGFDYMSNGLVAEIKRNVTALIETPEGTCAGDRSYGIRQDFIDMPVNVARNLAALAIIEKLEIYEPRAELREVTIDTSAMDGFIKNICWIGPSMEYMADSKEREDTGEE